MGKNSGGKGGWVLWGLALLALLVVLGLTASGVWRQIAHLRRLRAVEDELQTRIQYERERQQQLEKELRHVSSPDYVEEWARRYGKMVRPGEIPVVVPDAAGANPAGP